MENDTEKKGEEERSKLAAVLPQDCGASLLYQGERQWSSSRLITQAAAAAKPSLESSKEAKKCASNLK